MEKNKRQLEKNMNFYTNPGFSIINVIFLVQVGKKITKIAK